VAFGIAISMRRLTEFCYSRALNPRSSFRAGPTEATLSSAFRGRRISIPARTAGRCLCRSFDYPLSVGVVLRTVTQAEPCKPTQRAPELHYSIAVEPTSMGEDDELRRPAHERLGSCCGCVSLFC
jgi:hypothetical protein